ncbi:hypothetical protein GLOTRDRAFT_51116 [Gloeophyllum trabeum ATCC 11539]|uniref:DUF6589 domain-containing protein n=1 Tax=Gloeophyllum trabeum (strain ATCC 11539 / FP-39264 / Madison 617) TaxID=670483 RepID=S7PRQ1_GLOTA|nr:uncharacterized protein GLOTRDRAFT_51116 [Gloeophyllum trabeum ATCC 11539]EPQ50052.1 hypothetical protein GLOTRDRAFT_51116 [Gloeophyllum trabeum ATCC 11539]
MKTLIKPENGWHFNAVNASTDGLQDFRIEDMAADLQHLAPALWDLLDSLLTATRPWTASSSPDGGDEWLEDPDIDESPDVIPSQPKDKASRRKALLTISSSQKCNMLGSVMGVFLHACNTPSKVIQALAHMGISISVNTVEKAVTSLSKETRSKLRALGQTFLASYAYDNFDINFSTSSSTIEKSSDTLTHLTSGDVIKLEHGVTQEDLQCSDILWERSRLNPNADPSKIPRNMEAIINLLKQGGIGQPENQAKATGHMDMDSDDDSNGDGNSNEEWCDADVKDIVDFVVLIHGDLGTSERVQSILERRAPERSRWNRYQFVVFVMGLFHLKMACADAIWRIFLEKTRARLDENSLMRLAAIYRSKETGKLGSGPGFRRMHEVIREIGTALRLDCWRVEAQKRRSSCNSLEALAETKLPYSQIVEMSHALARNGYVADDTLYGLREQPSAVRDQQKENTSLMHKYMLLYEEISYGMNHGDIGRVETAFPSWILIFKAVGKNKYANAMEKFLTDVHFVFPEGLRRAVRYNILVNPTGKEGKFRGVDWVVELNNLFTKFTHGGSSSNYTKDRVILESPLIDVFRSCTENIERNLHLTDLTRRHSPPDLSKTYKALRDYMKTEGTNEYRAGRPTQYVITNAIDVGWANYLSNLDNTEDTDEILSDRNKPTAEDLGAED